MDSLNRLVDGIPIPGSTPGSENRILRCLATEFLGDWKWRRDSWLTLQHCSNPHWDLKSSLAFGGMFNQSLRNGSYSVLTGRQNLFAIFASWNLSISLKHRTLWNICPGETSTILCSGPQNPARKDARLHVWCLTFGDISKSQYHFRIVYFHDCIFSWRFLKWESLLPIPGVLTNLKHFHHTQIKFCSMHALNLGISQWIAAGAIIILKDDFELWGDDQNANDLYYRAWVDFVRWTKQKKIQSFDSKLEIEMESCMIFIGQKSQKY